MLLSKWVTLNAAPYSLYYYGAVCKSLNLALTRSI